MKLGDEQFAAAARVGAAGRLALVGMGVEPGLSDVFARYAADELFCEIDELGTRDGANLTVDGYDFAPSFSIWTTIEECLNPPVIWERDRGWFVTEPFSEPEVFDFPGGIGPVECVNVEHEEVLLMPRWVDAQRVTFKYGLGTEFIDVLKALRKIGLDRTDPVYGEGRVPSAPRRGRRLSARPATWATRCTARPAPGSGSPGPARTGDRARSTCTTWSTTRTRCASTASQCVVWQTAVNPVVALELLATGVWSGTGVLGPEAFPAEPFLELLAEATDRRGAWERLGATGVGMSPSGGSSWSATSPEMTATNDRGGTLDFGHRGGR